MMHLFIVKLVVIHVILSMARKYKVAYNYFDGVISFKSL